MLEYRQRSQDVQLVCALPDFPRYRKLAEKIAWVKPVVNFTYCWVNEFGQVSEE